MRELRVGLAVVVCLAMTMGGTFDLFADDLDGWVQGSGSFPGAVDPLEIVTDMAQAGSGSLYIPQQTRGWYRFAEQPLFGRLEFWVFDPAKSQKKDGPHYGPRWGVMNNPAPNAVPATGTPNDVVMGAHIYFQSWYSGNKSYAFNIGFANSTSYNSSWFSVIHPGGVFVSGVDPKGDGSAYRRGDPPPTNVGGDPVGGDPIDGVGIWTKWVFEVHDGGDYMFVVDEGLATEQVYTVIPEIGNVFDTGFSSNGFNQLFFMGGVDDLLSGLWIDELTFTPDDGQGAEAFSFHFDGSSPCAARGSEGDFNCDAEIGLLDLDILGQNWGATGVTYEEGDASGDGEVGLLDLDILGQYWGKGTSIPEPGVAGILAVAGLAMIRRR